MKRKITIVVEEKKKIPKSSAKKILPVESINNFMLNRRLSMKFIYGFIIFSLLSVWWQLDLCLRSATKTTKIFCDFTAEKNESELNKQECLMKRQTIGSSKPEWFHDTRSINKTLPNIEICALSWISQRINRRKYSWNSVNNKWGFGRTQFVPPECLINQISGVSQED